jgi:hypothetical protein
VLFYATIFELVYCYSSIRKLKHVLSFKHKKLNRYFKLKRIIKDFSGSSQDLWEGWRTSPEGYGATRQSSCRYGSLNVATHASEVAAVSHPGGNNTGQWTPNTVQRALFFLKTGYRCCHESPSPEIDFLQSSLL